MSMFTHNAPMFSCSHRGYCAVTDMRHNPRGRPSPADLYLPWCCQYPLLSASHTCLLPHPGKMRVSCCPSLDRSLTASSCVQGGLDFRLGKISLLKEWSGIGPGCPGQWWILHPWRGSKNMWIWHFRT